MSGKIQKTAFIFAIMLIFSTLSFAQEELVIIQHDQQGITLQYTPRVTMNRENSREGGGVRFDFEKARDTRESGLFYLPFRTVMLGIPSDANPVVTVVEAKFRIIANSKPISRAEILLFSGNEGTSWIHGIAANEDFSGLFRLQKVISVGLYPVDYNIKTDQAKLYEKIVVRVDYNRAGEAVSEFEQKDSFEEEYRAGLLNYETSRKWRIQQKRSLPKQNSLLSSGLWYTIPVTGEGIYKITYSDLTQSNISMAGIDPSTIRMFNNGGEMIPEFQTELLGNGELQEIAIRVVGGEDGTFDTQDYILFFGKGPMSAGWSSSAGEPRHTNNVYSNNNLYWFTYGGTSGKRMRLQESSNSGTTPRSTATNLVYLEDENIIFYESGNRFYMKEITPEDAFFPKYAIKLPGYAEGSSAKYRLNFYTPHKYSGGNISQNTVAVKVDSTYIDFLPVEGVGVNRLVGNNAVFPPNGDFDFTIENISSDNYSHVWLDWIEFEYTRNLTATENSLRFYGPKTPGATSFVLNGFSSSPVEVYNISANGDVYQIAYTASGNESIVFSDMITSEDQQYLAVTPVSYLEITKITEQPNSDLRGSFVNADMIIATPNAFLEEATKLAHHRIEYDGLATEVVSVEEIYNEFGAGIADPTAIRLFTQHAFRNWLNSNGNPPQYLLLFGDGNYDYRHIISTSDENIIVPYEVSHPADLYTYTTDDYFVQVSGDDGIVDMAVGRLPVKNMEMAKDVVDKIIAYQTDPEYGSWRNRITTVADDEITPHSDWEILHTRDAERVTEASYVPDYLDKTKIYLMEYEAELNVTNFSNQKIDAQDDLIAQMNNGTRMIVYFGHGNHLLLAHEHVLDYTDMQRIQNGRKQFFFYIASCAFGRWDMNDEDSMAEQLLTAQGRGAIGLISSARDVFASGNYTLADEFYEHLYTGTRETRTVGQAMMLAKSSDSSINSKKFHILADPALKIEFPQNNISSLSMNPDSLKAMVTAEVTGKLDQVYGADGTVYLSVFDAEKQGVYVTKASSPRTVYYKLPGAPIFRGSSSAELNENDQFSMNFIVPRDITYGGQNGRITAYYSDSDGDASTFVDGLPVGGTANAVNDYKGPEVEVFFDGRKFISGDIVRENPTLELKLSDPQGVNVTGEIGHKIEFTINNSQDVRDISDEFEYENGSYTSGSAVVNMDELAQGPVVFSVRAWDNFNNSSTYTASMQIVSEDQLVVDNVVNYPNPFAEETQFTAQISDIAEVEIKIFTIAGRLIKTLSGLQTGSSNFFVSPKWDGRDEDGDRVANGTYLYKMIVRSQFAAETQQVEKIGKLVIMK